MYSGVDRLEGRKVRSSVATLKLLKKTHTYHKTQQRQPMRDDDARVQSSSTASSSIPALALVKTQQQQNPMRDDDG